jgi:O-antigen ligase
VIPRIGRIDYEGALTKRTESPDVVTALTVFIALQLAIPSALRFVPLGGVGYLAALWAFGLGLWWLWARARYGMLTPVPSNPVKAAALLFLGAVLLSYAWSMRRALPTTEATQADLGLLRLVMGVSLILIASDGITKSERLLVLLRRASIAGGLFAGLGILQFITGRALTEWISIPGFTRLEYPELIERSGFTRSSSTATHPLEYGTALTVLFPIALSLALYDSSRWRWARWASTGAILLALVLSGSRSSYLGLLVGVVIIATAWSRQIRLRMLAAGIALMVVVFVAVPGMVGTIRGLFLYLGEDPSVQSRADSYGIVWEFFARSPILGRGAGTFLPMYRILDSQILLIVIELGIVGALAFLGLIASAVFSPLVARRSVSDSLPKNLGLAISAGVAAGAILMLFFDAFGFPISFGMWFLIVALSGAYWRVCTRAPDAL